MKKQLKPIIAELTRIIGSIEDQIKEDSGIRELTHTQLAYLESISMLKNPTLTELANSLKLKKPTVTVGIEKLIEKQFIIKVKSDEDRRSAHIHLTSKGELVNVMHDKIHQEYAAFFSKKLSETELIILIELLAKVIR